MELADKISRAPARKFEDLIVWQKGHQFVLDVYAFTTSFPREEVFGLTSQFRRAAISVVANIAEGYKKKGKKEKMRFYNISQGSIEECRYYLILSKDLKYGMEDINRNLNKNLTEVSKLLHSYISAISSSDF